MYYEDLRYLVTFEIVAEQLFASNNCLALGATISIFIPFYPLQ